MESRLLVKASEDLVILQNIPVDIDLSSVMTRLAFHSDISVRRGAAAGLLKRVVSSARPAAIYKSSPVRPKANNYLEIDRKIFNSPLLKVNLRKVDRVFPYVITFEQETNNSLIPDDHSNQSYIVTVIRGMILLEALNYLRNYITNRYNLDLLWSLQPGEMEAWPAADRKSILSILGNADKLLGVTLSKDNKLLPEYSECGIFYDARIEFEGCQVCPQEPCMGRRVPYCEELAQKYSDMSRGPCGKSPRILEPSKASQLVSRPENQRIKIFPGRRIE
jgi:hypothetical protein